MKFFSRILLNFILFMAFSGLFPAQFFLGSSYWPSRSS